MESGRRTGVCFASGHAHTQKIWVKFGWNLLSVGKSERNFSPEAYLMTKQRSSKEPKDQQKPRQLNQEQELALWFTGNSHSDNPAQQESADSENTFRHSWPSCGKTDTIS